MMKKLLLLLLFALVIPFAAYAEINVDSVTLNPASLYSGQVLTFTITVTNLDAGVDADVLVQTSDAREAGGSVINMPGGDLPDNGDGRADGVSIVPSGSATFTVQADLPDVMAVPGTYTATLSVEDVVSGDIKTQDYTFTIRNPLVITLNARDIGNPLSIDLESGENENSLSLRVENRGTVALTNVRVTSSFATEDLEDNDNDQIEITQPGAIASISPGGSATVEFNFDVDSGFDVSTINGNLEVRTNEFDGLARVLVNGLTLNVRPLACSPGSSADDLNLDINKPDNDNEFETGDTIDVDLDIENNGDDDIDSKVEAVLYNNDKDRKADTHVVTKRVRDDDQERVQFTMELDTSDDEDYTLFLKVFDDDDESECKIDEVSLDVQIPEHKVKINDPTLAPSSVSCGGRVSGVATLENVGDNDEGVTFEVSNAQLGLRETSSSFDLEQEEERAVNFGFTVPQNAQAGTYQMILKARYSGEDTLSALPLTVQSCTQTSEESTDTTGILPTTGNVVSNPTSLTEKSLFDRFNAKTSGLPTSVWVLIDVLLGVLILGALVWIFRSR